MVEKVFAAVGDVHGAMKLMVRLVREREAAAGCRVDFVVQVGDFEPHRNEDDLLTMAAPAKFRLLGDFREFHEGRERFPWPIRFIGGNHEPYGFLDSLAPNTEIAPNCTYLGRAGRACWDGLTVAWLSGIHRERAFGRPRPSVKEFGRASNKDFVNFTQDDVQSVESGGPADLLVLHEWPSGIVASIGNVWGRYLMERLRPRLVLCGHMHKAYRRSIEPQPGHRTQVCCLGKVGLGSDSVALFRLSADGSVCELLIYA